MLAKRNTIPIALTCAVILLFGTGAKKTKLGDSWTDPDFTGGPIKKVLVIGIAQKEERRQVFENQFMTTFRNAGIAAEASYNLIPNEEKLTKEIVDAAIEGKGFDAVILTRMIDIDLKTEHHSGGYSVLPGGYYNSLYGYYGYSYTAVRAPDYTDYKEIYSLETTLYEVPSEKLIWTVQSQSVRKVSIYDTIKDFTSKIIKRLKKDGLV